MAVILGTSGDDNLFATSTDEQILGLEGNDTLDAVPGQGNNLLQGNDGDDELYANTNDQLYGQDGDDTLDASAGNGGNLIYGDDNSDWLFAGNNDDLFGGEGIDYLFAGLQVSRLTGGSSGDAFYIAQAEIPLTPSIVTDFTQGIDLMGIGGLNGIVDGFDDLEFDQIEGNTIIKTTGDQPLSILQGFSGTLTADDFVFNNESPVLIETPDLEDGRFSVAALNPPGTKLGQVMGDGVSDTDTLTYDIISGNPDNNLNGIPALAIDSDTGIITVADSTDISSATTFPITVQVTNQSNLSDTGTIVIDVFEPPQPNGDIILTPIGVYETGIFDEGAAEIPAYDAETQRLFVVNGGDKTIDILDLSNPTNPTLIQAIDITPYGDAPNSVAIKNGIVAVAVAADPKTDAGTIVFFNTDGEFINQVTAGFLPDMVGFSPDGTMLLAANEGEPNDEYTIDPVGSISIIDLSGGVENLTQDDVINADFSSFNDQAQELADEGVILQNPDSSVAQNLEPEYIAIAPDGNSALVTLQENNALALVDINRDSATFGTVIDILPLGFKEYFAENALDASNEDEGININNWPVFGMYQPDTINSFVIDGETYYITANEGEAVDYDGFSNLTRVEDIFLDPIAFPNTLSLQEEETLGRLTIIDSLGDTDDDGEYEQLYSFGGRSFSIWDDAGNLVYDSGDQFEQITAAALPSEFNSTNDENDSFDNRSDDKGPEPEGVTVGIVDGVTYGFIGLERIGGVMVYNLSNPDEPEFVQYINTRNFLGDPEAGTAGDLAPEGLAFISAEDSPNGRPLLVVANEVSGSTRIFEINSDDDVDTDGDGIIDSIESKAGDRNQDGIMDFQQSNVVSLPKLNGDPDKINDYFTIVAPEQISFVNTQLVTPNPNPDGSPDNVDFPYGFLSYDIEGIESGQKVPILQLLPEGISPNTYWNYDPDTETFSEFVFDGETGATFYELGSDAFANTLQIIYIDGGRGDQDQTADGIITDISSPGVSSGSVEIMTDSAQEVIEIVGDNGTTPVNFFRNEVNSTFLNEVGFFIVDDQNQVNGIAPGEAGYTEAALESAETIFSVLSNRSDNILTGNNLSRDFQLATGDRIALYLIPDSNRETLLIDGVDTADVFFSITEANPDGLNYVQIIENDGEIVLGWEDEYNGTDQDFDNLIMTLSQQSTSLTLPNLIATSQGGLETQVIDLSLLDGQSLQTDVIVNREAGFNNLVGLYPVLNPDGAILDPETDELINPTADTRERYAQLAYETRLSGISFSTPDEQTTEYSDLVIAGGQLYAPFIISNANTPNQDYSNIYFPYIGVNADQTDHVAILGDNLFGFEDLPGGGDQDYNDLTIQFSNLTMI